MEEASRHGIYLLAGSILEPIDGSTKVYNTSVLLDRDGHEIARYRKLHLFDINVPGQVQAGICSFARVRSRTLPS